MKEILLIKNGEIALKGLNRNTFESILIKNIRFRLKDLGKFNIRVAQSTVYIEPLEENIDFETAVERIRKIFGIAVFSRAAVAEKNYEDIKKTALEYLQDLMPDVKTFKVDAKRSDKHFPMKSPGTFSPPKFNPNMSAIWVVKIVTAIPLVKPTMIG